jgi:hypothetical protein
MRVKTICCSLVTGLLLSLPHVAQAGVSPDVKRDFAHAVYQGSPEFVHDHQPQALLRAVIVLNVRLDQGNKWRAEVLRTNEQQPEMLARALETVRRAPAIAVADDAREELQRNGLVEAWLFDNDGTFQVMTLAKPQRDH